MTSKLMKLENKFQACTLLVFVILGFLFIKQKFSEQTSYYYLLLVHNQNKIKVKHK